MIRKFIRAAFVAIVLITIGSMALLAGSEIHTAFTDAPPHPVSQILNDK